MQTRMLLVLAFIIISLVPASILSAISFLSLSKLEQSISNLYLGTVTIISNLSDGHKALVDMRLNIGRFISTTNAQEEQRILDQINENEGVFLKTLIEYRQIGDFPLQVEILQQRGQGNLTSYETSLLTQVNSDWRDYQQTRNRVIDLANQGLRENATAYSNTIAADKFSKLAESYNKIVDLNNNLASIMFDESQSVTKQAYTAAIITSVSSIAFAIGAAILVSKRLAPSVDELQREAKKKIEKFISRGGSSSTPPLETTADVQSENTEMVLPVSVGGSNGDDNDDDNNGNNNISAENQQQLADLIKRGPMILMHSSQYEGLEGHDRTSEDRERRKGPADSLLDYYFLSASQLYSSLSSSTTNAAESLASAASDKNKNNLVLITKRTSNLYLRGRSAGAAIFILSSSAQDPLTTSEDGLLVISIGQTSLILEAIKRTLRENPNSIIVLDNLTELIYKIGFTKVFSLVQSVSDEISQYSHSRIIILINENAHPRGEVEAIATICNAFVR